MLFSEEYQNAYDAITVFVHDTRFCSEYISFAWSTLKLRNAEDTKNQDTIK